ncbi:NAD(P)/FAD-dependent oxidoreductase [Bacillus sp. FSL K6-3431]|uniref:NAD(P)/FAD-dependent oxidoreductase n=1 Tax=Bacillus sp. FSL K6-3431 TaxID=2921500 RepID=UPI0030FD0B06
MEKIIVIGTGILGASTAYHLAKAGADVTVIDRKDQGQATDAAAGIVCPWVSQRRNQAWYTLAKNGARFYPGLIRGLEKEGETNTGYARVGAISIHTDGKKLLEMEKRALLRMEDAPEMGQIQVLTPSETSALFPPLDDGYGSVHISGAARVDGRALRDSLLRSAKRHGASIVRGDASLLFSGNKVIGVKTSEESYSANTVIVTSGAWAQQLLQPMGITFQVNFQKAQIVHLQLSDLDTKEWPVVMPPGNQYIVPFNDGKIVAGATHEDNTGFDLRTTMGGMQEVFQKALQFAPGLSDSTYIETRVGFRPFTPGFLPVIGPLPNYQNILVANGLGASGLTMGPYLGCELAKIALGEKLDIDLNQYDVGGALQ